MTVKELIEKLKELPGDTIVETKRSGIPNYTEEFKYEPQYKLVIIKA